MGSDSSIKELGPHAEEDRLWSEAEVLVVDPDEPPPTDSNNSIEELPPLTNEPDKK